MIQRVSGSAGAAAMECVNPRKDKWRVRFGMVENNDGTATWIEADFAHKPTDEEVRNAIAEYYNGETSAKILSGYKWNGQTVWLSVENQMNYKAELEVMNVTGSISRPVRLKLGTDAEPVYYDIETEEEYTEFVAGMTRHISTALREGWEKKDAAMKEWLLEIKK